MEIKKKWTATSNPKEYERRGLQDLAGRWNIGIDVSIIRPYTYSKGPIIKSLNKSDKLD